MTIEDMIDGKIGTTDVQALYLGASQLWSKAPAGPPADVIGPDGYGYNRLADLWDVSNESITGLPDQNNQMLAAITNEFGAGYQPADFTDFQAIAGAGGDFTFLYGIEGISNILTDTIGMYWQGAAVNSGYAYFSYDGSGTDFASAQSTNPFGIIYCGRWNGARVRLIRTVNPV